MTEVQIPPHDDDAERALLSAFLEDPSCAAKCAGTLYDDDFYTEAHRLIFRAVRACVAREPAPVGSILVAPLVRAELSRMGDRGAAAMAALPDIAMLGANPSTADQYAKTVRGHAASREAVRAAMEVMAQAATDGAAALELGRQRFAERHAAFDHNDVKARPRTTTMNDLMGEDEDHRPAFWPGLVHPSSVTLMVGWPKAGKTWLYAGLLATLERGESWLGREPFTGGAVKALVATEEPPAIVRSWGRRFGLRDVVLVTRREAGPILSMPWVGRVAWLSAQARDHGCPILVVDTLRFWAALGPKDENDAGAVQAAMSPLLLAAGQNDLAVVVTHHARKQEGTGGTAAAGSLAFNGAADTIVELRPFDPREDDDPRRKIKALGRFVDPENRFGAEQVVRYVSPDGDTPATYTLEGTAFEARDAEVRRKLADAARVNPDLTGPELIHIAEVRKADGARVLKVMVGHELLRFGTGKSGDPHRYKYINRAEGAP